MTLTAPLTEAELVRRGRSGDEQALSELVRLHEDRITALCRSRLRTAEDAADAAQETFVRALGRLDQLQDADAFGPWLRTIAVRVCADEGRERIRWMTSSLATDTVDDAPSPDELVETADVHEHLQQALHGLGDRDRRALWLRHGMEAPVAVVAAELGVTEGSARVLLTRARHRLRRATAGLAALVPAPLRDWWSTLSLRSDVLSPLVPLAVAATVAAVVISLPDPRPAPEPPPGAPGPTPAAAVPDDVDIPAADAAEQPAPAPAPPASARDGRAAPSPHPGDDAVAPVPSVRVQEGYPEDEDGYLAEIQLYDGEGAEDGEEGGTLRIYGDPVGEPGETVEEAVNGLLGG